LGNYKTYGSWREMYLNRPRLNFDGLYISKCSYIRAGEQSLDSFYRPWHLVEYFRYLRFFSDGFVVMLTTPDEPKIGVTKLKGKIDNRDPYVLKGNWTLESNKVI
jgi:F-box protein 9